MAGLINTGIWGFICSAKLTGRKILNSAGQELDEWVSTFVSNLSGWMIDKLGNAEFKSVFVRDKFITNEFVYNRIRVTEDEEIISSSMKIASYIDNEDGTYTAYPDLREGDINQLADGDLLLGYYHNPANSGVIYSVQKFTAVNDPSSEDQSITLEPEGESIPYQHMIIVRVGNITDEDRQSFIRISSRTNCQYFHDGINSWTAYDDPEHVKCVLGHADIGLIPAWAKNAVSGIKRWFGLIADGVIIRGTFILHNDKTIEDELNSREIQIRGDFEIREDGITGKWQEVISYAQEASDSASSASKSATAAGESVTKIEKLSSEFNVNAEKLSGEFSKKVETETSNALGTITTATEEATGSLQLTAKDFTLAFAKTVEEKTTEATGAISTATEKYKSELNITAQELTSKFEQSFTDAEGNIIKEIGTQVTQNAKQWKVEVMGSDADGNPNKILAAINASDEGIKIDGDKVEITGELIAQIIMATGLNIADKFVVTKVGDEVKVDVKGRIETATNGKRILIDPETSTITLFDNNNNIVAEIGFEGDSLDNPLSSRIKLFGRGSLDSQPLRSLDLQPDKITMTVAPSRPSSTGPIVMTLDTVDGLVFRDNKGIIKQYGIF